MKVEMPRSKILINGSMITPNVTGVGVQNIYLLANLIPLLYKENFEICVYCYDKSNLLKFQTFATIKSISMGKYLDKFFLKYLSVYNDDI